MKRKLSLGGNSTKNFSLPNSIPAILGPALVLFLPVVSGRGVVFMRDPSFLATVQADVFSSFGAFSFHGGISNIATQGLFYEPYALVEEALRFIGLSAGLVSKVIPMLLVLVASIGIVRIMALLEVGIVGASIAAFFYVLNPWSLDQFGYFYLWTGYCLLPWVIIGVRKLGSRPSRPLFLALSLIFSGGLEAWVNAFVVMLVFLVVDQDLEAAIRLKRFIKGIAIYLMVGTYWIVPYSIWIFQQRDLKSFTSITGGLLQSRMPFVNLLEMQDFWWPHLNPLSAAGTFLDGLSLTVCFMVSILAIRWGVVNLFSSRKHVLAVDDVLTLKRSLTIIGIIGLAFGSGSIGPIGILYKFVHSWPFTGHAFVAALTRSPANFGGPFVASVAIFLGFVSDSVKKFLLPSFFRYVLALGVVFFGCLPSVMAFWQAYKPIQIPNQYELAAAKVPKGVALQIGSWNSAAIFPQTGVAEFEWSSRMVADPTLLNSYIRGSSLSPLVASTSSLGAKFIQLSQGEGGIQRIENLADELDIHGLVIEDDVVQDSYDPLPEFVARLRNAGLVRYSYKGITVASLPGQSKGELWANGCYIDTKSVWSGLVHVTCMGNITNATINSVFQLSAPISGAGVHLGAAHSLTDGQGFSVGVISGTHGWIIMWPIFLTIVSITISILYIVILLIFQLAVKEIDS